jgi:class 3 adenylate cyclase
MGAMPDPSSPSGSETADALGAGREARGRHAWAAAYDLFDRADQAGLLSGADLEAFAEAAFFVARGDRQNELQERAFKAYQAAGDGFFAAFETARQAIDCATAIQHALAEHRRSSGFALSVRIGLHTAHASRRGDDYSGVGVHTAARVADLAEAGEILATTETFAEAGLTASDPRQVSVKGVTTPVTIAALAWR